MLKNKRDDKLNAGLQRCPHPEGIDSAGNGKLLKKQAVLNQRQEEFTALGGQRGLRVAGLL